MRIAIFDYRIVPTNPVGSCHLRMLKGLCDRHDFTVFSVEFDNPRPDRIRWVRIPLPVRPYVLLYALFHLAAPIACAWHCLTRRARFDLVQMVESNLLFGDIAYSHFCHRRYLRLHWRETRASGLRGFVRGAAHRAAGLIEPLVYRRVSRIVTTSHGLKAELADEYPGQEQKFHVLANPVDVEALEPPDPTERRQIREMLGVKANEIVFLFAALGHFERKGLSHILEALARLQDSRLRLIVVGGQPDLIAEYRNRAKAMKLETAVRFEGMQRDMRRYYWSADALVFPTCYETFCLVTLEAAAAALPLICTKVNGVEEFLRDGENGLIVERTVDSVCEGIRRFLALGFAERCEMRRYARQSVMRYSSDNYVTAWEEFYEQVA
jgi:glycosyltransferase involved in cell wall biosynthesis